jgi:hypothetical protein
MTDVFTLGITAGLGWSLARANLCSVAATQEAITAERATGLYLQTIALATAAVVLLGLSWWVGDFGRLPGDGGTRATVAVAAIVMALGAWLNGSCFLGNLTHLGRGNANYLFTLAGIALAAQVRLAERWGLASPLALQPPPNHRVLSVAILIAALIALAAVRAIGRDKDPGDAARFGETLKVGLFAGALMLQAPGWSYVTVLNAVGHSSAVPFDALLIAPAAALFAGAVASALTSGTWAPRAPTILGALRCLAGGFVMQSAAHCIPGSSDVLLLWVIPGLGGYGLLAYSLFLSTLLLTWQFKKFVVTVGR